MNWFLDELGAKAAERERLGLNRRLVVRIARASKVLSQVTRG